jgi:hypothetical protein
MKGNRKPPKTPLNRHWIKLWLEVLDDPKMGGLPDDLWRLAIELFLVAGENGNNGKIPEKSALSWRLRRRENDLEILLKKLEKTGIVRQLKTGWVVSRFKKRQSAVPGTERTRAARRNEGTAGHGYSGNESVTTRYQNRTDKKNREDKRGSTPPKGRERYLK